MQAVDTNLLVYAHRKEARQHPAAAHLLRELAEGVTPWAIPSPCVHEFFSVATNRRNWRSAASTGAQAWAQIDAWLDSPSVGLLAENEAVATILERFVDRPRVRGPVVHDARLAALCAAHGVDVLLTHDRVFTLFPEIETLDPVRG